MLKRIVGNGIKTGVVLTLTTTIAIMAAAQLETGDPWAAINAISHIVDGDGISPPNGFHPRESGIGVAINTMAMLSWALLYEGALVLSESRSGPVTGIAGAAVAYTVDYRVLPPRLTPGIEKRLSGGAVLSSYVAIALTLGASRLWNPDTQSGGAANT